MNAVQMGCWFEPTPRHGEPYFVMDDPVSKWGDADDCVVVAKAGRASIDAVLEAGVGQVYIGEAALHDDHLIAELTNRYGTERIGVWLPVQLTTVQWNLDRESNADFSFVAASTPIPRWVVQRANGTPTDVDAQWWVAEMFKSGCCSVMVSVKNAQDDDLLPCAEMSELAGVNFYLDAGTADVEELRYWVKYGQVKRLVLPTGSDIDTVAVRLNERLSEEALSG